MEKHRVDCANRTGWSAGRSRCDQVSVPEDMTIRRQVGSLVVALLFSVCAGHVCSAQELVTEHPTSEAAAAKHNPSLHTDAPPQAWHNEPWSETGFLAGEGALNSLVAVESFKYSLGRERPYQGDGSGPYFQSGGTSFPSEHAAAAWSVAGVIAHEYPGPFTKIMAYGLASLVSVSRVKAHQHFPSDVVVGSVIGNLVAQDIYSRHHDFNLGGSEWRSLSAIARGFESSGPPNLRSPYVPLDSWIYPALDRLAGLGLIDSGFAGMRHWTRSECTRLLNEAGEKIDEEGSGG